MVIVLPSAETSVSSALTRCQAGLSTIALSEEWMSFAGPRPHFSPLDDQLELDDALRAEADRDDAVGVLRRRRHEDADASCASAASHLGPADDLPDVRRADLLLALGDQHEVDRQLPAGAADRVQRGEERRLRALLVDRAAARSITLPRPGLSTMRASSGGEVHSAGSNCFTSYMK